jgi:hypothetical protein
MTSRSDNSGIVLAVAGTFAVGMFVAAVVLSQQDEPDTTLCRTDVATMVQQDGPKMWPESCAGLSTGQQDEVSAAVVRDLLNG